MNRHTRRQKIANKYRVETGLSAIRSLGLAARDNPLRKKKILPNARPRNFSEKSKRFESSESDSSDFDSKLKETKKPTPMSCCHQCNNPRRFMYKCGGCSICLCIECVKQLCSKDKFGYIDESSRLNCPACNAPVPLNRVLSGLGSPRPAGVLCPVCKDSAMGLNVTHCLNCDSWVHTTKCCKDNKEDYPCPICQKGIDSRLVMDVPLRDWFIKSKLDPWRNAPVLPIFA